MFWAKTAQSHPRLLQNFAPRKSAFYGQHVQSSYWTPFDIGGVVTDGLAVVWCHRHTRRQWAGTEPPRDLNYTNTAFISRSSMVFRKEEGQWRVVHAHFSPADAGPRPGGI